MGEAPALGNQTGLNRQVCMHESRWARCEPEWNSEASSIWPSVHFTVVPEEFMGKALGSCSFA